MLAKRRRQGKRGNILLAMRRHAPRRLSNFILQNSMNAFSGRYLGPRAVVVWLTNREMNRSSSER